MSELERSGFTCALKKITVLLFIGGTAYIFVELMWRGHSHISMFVVGGLCFVLIGCINEYLPWEMGLVWQSLIGAGIVTSMEFMSGVILNLWLGLGVWDYSTMPLNVLGQICLPFTMAWIPLSCVGIVLDDYLRYWLFDEERPHYILI